MDKMDKEEKISRIMQAIENHIRHLYNSAYAQGYADGKKKVLDSEIIKMISEALEDEDE